jgi:hypothetical protein
VGSHAVGPSGGRASAAAGASVVEGGASSADMLTLPQPAASAADIHSVQVLMPPKA